jgi:hypothetical protein
MKPFIPVLMTARERASLLAEFDGTALRPGSMTAPGVAAPSATGAAPVPAGFVDHMKAALAAAGKRLAEAGAGR